VRDEPRICATRPDGQSGALLLAAARYAALAPSSHNSQPWAFRVTDDALELFADRTRALPRVDPRDRALIISCGAALFHARIALRSFGYQDEVELFPDRRSRDLLARMRLGDRHDPTAEERSLFDAIPQRRTYRFPFEPTPVAKPLVAELQHAASAEDAWLRILEGAAVRDVVANLIARGDGSRWRTPQSGGSSPDGRAPTRAGQRMASPGTRSGSGL
jgi:hypothetical protein